MKPLTRFAIAGGLLFLAVNGLPVASPLPEIQIEKPSAAMLKAVDAVQRIMRGASPVDRSLWAEVWNKCGKIIANETETEVVFTDTRSLRKFNIIAMQIAWRRLADNPKGKYIGLSEAVEHVFAEAIGLDVVPVTPELRNRFRETCTALAWCGAGRG